MSKRKIARHEIDADRLAPVIGELVAELDSQRIAGPQARRLAAEQRLRAVYDIVRPKWNASTLEASIAHPIIFARRKLTRGEWTEKQAVRFCFERIVDAMDDPAAPPWKDPGTSAREDLVLACLRAPPRKMLAVTLGALLGALDGTIRTPESVSKMLRRKRLLA